MTSMTYILNSCYQDRCHVFLIATDNKLHLDPMSLLGDDMAAKRALLLYTGVLVGVFLHYIS